MLSRHSKYSAILLKIHSYRFILSFSYIITEVVLYEGNCTDICKQKGLACSYQMKDDPAEIAASVGMNCQTHSSKTKKWHPSVFNEECQGMSDIGVVECDENPPPGVKRVCDCISPGLF